VPDRIFRTALGAILFLALAACSEQVVSSLGCPQLCTDQSASLRDTILTDVVVLDSTLVGFPLLGETRELSLVARGDTADVRVVARYDTLPSVYRVPGATADSTIRRVDSATFIFRIDTTVTKPRIAVTIDAFDVDTTAADTATAALLPLFRPDRLLGSATYQPADVKDTLRLPLDNAAILAKIGGTRRLRIGLRLRAGGSATLRVAGTSFSPRVRLRVAADTTVAPDTIALASHTPADDPTTAVALALYPVIAAGTLPPPSSGRLALGGIAGARSYLRFAIPAIVLDSVQVIRASLLLTQQPSRSAGGSRDTLTVYTQAVVAGPGVTDVFTASQFRAPFGSFSVDTLRLVPRDSGQRDLELVNVVRAWRAVGTTNTTRALVISVAEERSSPGELNFFSIEGPAAVRPRLRLTFVPRRGFGIP
jgi:hypothetical protein